MSKTIIFLAVKNFHFAVIYIPLNLLCSERFHFAVIYMPLNLSLPGQSNTVKYVLNSHTRQCKIVLTVYDSEN